MVGDLLAERATGLLLTATRIVTDVRAEQPNRAIHS
jgi:hypothetical protein